MAVGADHWRNHVTSGSVNGDLSPVFFQAVAGPLGTLYGFIVKNSTEVLYWRKG